MRIGILPLGRGTFDVAYAEETLDAMLAALDATGHQVDGPRALLLDETATRQAIDALRAENLDRVVVLQVTFTDAAMAAVISAEFDQPLAIWAVPEPRLGGRLRLNSFCGLNLASHALGLRGRDFGWLYAAPTDDIQDQLSALLDGRRQAGRLTPAPPPATTPEGEAIAAAIRGKRIARIGQHPAGFDTCAYDAGALRALSGVEVDEIELDALFTAARAAPAQTARALRDEVAGLVATLDDLDQPQLDLSLRLKAGLDDLRLGGGYDAFAIRCWPETFTEYGGAVCGPAGMMTEARVPCACEADVYGALTQLVLMQAAQAPVFLADLVDMDARDDTGVVWHCGQAPVSMRDPESRVEAIVHTNRKRPLLYQFTLKPGPVTFLRISQAHGQPRMVLAHGEMQRRPMAFTGTSGVVRFGRNAGDVLNDILASGLEHHMALAYGDHRAALRGVAGAMDLAMVEL